MSGITSDREEMTGHADHPATSQSSDGGDARPETIWSLVEQHARRDPSRAAVIDLDGTPVDYERLTARADRVAGEVLASGVRPGSVVGVCVARGADLVAALLGVLRAGCGYVPLDPEYPRDRVRYMLGDSGADLVVVDGAESAQRCGTWSRLVRLDDLADDRAAAPVEPPPAPGDLAYVIYTSGSTGSPKGVAVEHRSVVAMARAMGRILGEDELAGVLGATSVCFDPSVMEILGTLMLGGTVVLAPTVLDLPDLPAADRVRTVITVPSAMRSLLVTRDLPAGVRCVLLGGEVFKPSLARLLLDRRPAPRVINVYGPTEVTVFATATEVSSAERPTTIGAPVAGVRAYVLDDAMEPAPPGASGELFLAGDQVARGYLNDEHRTHEQFLSLRPGGAVPETRLYRTGDRCTWTDSGELVFLGRQDQQVKVRGFRIELEEVESALELVEGVSSAAASVSETDDGKRMLVGYVVSPTQITGEAARASVAERLPRYMVPQVVLRLDRLPTSTNGKLDRAQLPPPPAPARPGDDGRHGVDPVAGIPALRDLPPSALGPVLLDVARTEIARHLGIPPGEVPTAEPLDTVGLDSLDAAEVSYRISKRVGVELSARSLERLTLAAAVEHLADALGNGHGGLAPADGLQASPEPRPAESLTHVQAQLRTGYPLFVAAKVHAWSVRDKAALVRELELLLGRAGLNPYGKAVSTGSDRAGTVVDLHTGERRECVIWTTNLYLGLNRDPQVVAEAQAAVERFGTGMGTSSAASGRTDLHTQFETEFADLVGMPGACLFPTGFTSSLGVVAGLLGEGDVVVMDQLCHASIVDGARLCGAAVRTFNHNDVADLEAVLASEASAHRTTMVVLESVYGMGEGVAPVAEIAETAKRHGALVMVDEAHSFGFYGPRGAGLCAELGVTDDVDLITTPLSKALGSLGGVVAASEEHIALLRTASRAYVFQATCTPADIAAALAALRRVRSDDALRQRLWDTTAYMRRRFTEAGYDIGPGDGPLVTPIFADTDVLYETTRGMYERGVHTAAVTYPIVERGRGRMRFICSASHTRDDVDATVEALVAAHRDAERRREQSVEQGSQAPAAPEQPGDPRPRRPEVAAWAATFEDAVLADLAKVAGPAPSLRVVVELTDASPPVVVDIQGRPGASGPTPVAVPELALTLGTDRAVAALCAFDVQAVLSSVLDGSCALRGQEEAFVWFVGAMARCRETRAA